MASRVGDIQTSIWSDPDFERLSVEAKALYIWSFSNSLVNNAHLYHVGPGRMQNELKLPPKRWEDAMSELIDSGFVAYECDWLWCCAGIKYIRSKSPSMARGIVNDLRHPGIEPQIRRDLVERYAEWPWLVDKGATQGWPELVAEVRSTELNQDTLRRGSGGGLQTPQGTGIGRSTATPTTSRARSKPMSTDAVPGELPENLARIVGPVKEILDRIVAAKGGTVEPTLAATGRAIGAFPNRNHLREAGALEHWFVHGKGRNRPNKDVVQRYRSWLENADAYTGPQAVPAPAGPVETDDERYERRLREQRQ